jgi:hypothetical protein
MLGFLKHSVCSVLGPFSLFLHMGRLKVFVTKRVFLGLRVWMKNNCQLIRANNPWIQPVFVSCIGLHLVWTLISGSHPIVRSCSSTQWAAAHRLEAITGRCEDMSSTLRHHWYTTVTCCHRQSIMSSNWFELLGSTTQNLDPPTYSQLYAISRQLLPSS